MSDRATQLPPRLRPRLSPRPRPWPPPRLGAWLRPLARAAGALSVAAGLVLRFYTRSALWLDESLSVNISKLPLGDIGDALRRDGHPPLYYWLLHGWMDVFGSGDRSVRAMSGVCAIAALPVAALVARRLGGRHAVVAVTILLATSPYTIRYATEARMYALVMLFVVVGWYALLRAIDELTPVWLVLIAVIVGALVLTHYWALYLLAATVLVFGYRGWRRPATRASTAWILASMAIGSLAFVPWLGGFMAQVRHTGTPWSGAGRPSVVLAETINNLGGFVADGEVLGVCVVMLVILGVFGRATGHHRVELDVGTTGAAHGEAAIVMVTLVIAVTAMLASNSAYATRYAAVIVPIIMVLAGLGVSRITSSSVRSVVVGMAVVLALPGIVYNVRVQRTQGGQVVAAINAGAQAGDVIVYCPDQLGPAGSRHLRRDVQAVRFPDLGDPRFVDWRDYADRNAKNNPQAFAAAVLGVAGSHSVWYAWRGGYRTFGDQCEQLASALAAKRSTTPVLNTDEHVFEPASLTRYNP